jgi:hypothetical protein
MIPLPCVDYEAVPTLLTRRKTVNLFPLTGVRHLELWAGMPRRFFR